MLNKEQVQLAKHYFFTAYKNTVDYILLTCKEYSMYNIYVSKIVKDEDHAIVSISVNNNRYNKHASERIYEDKKNNSYFTYSNNITLPANEAEELIDSIREDFEYNHVIVYSSVNPASMIQTLQNTRFSLYIKLNNEEELEKAMNLNSRINTDEERIAKVLRRK